MNTITKFAMATLLGLAVTTTMVSADAQKGKRVYQKFMKDDCTVTGGVVSGKLAQKQWKKMKANGKFKAELEKICPQTKAFLSGDKFKKLETHLYDFMYEFGKGSGNIPAC